MKLCKNCKHFLPNTTAWGSPKYQEEFATCKRTGVVTDLAGRHCSTERLPLWPVSVLLRMCGREARFWEAKE